MSLLSRIRQNIGLVAAVIFIAIIAFLLGDLLSGLDRMRGAAVAGEVAGQEIPYQEYSRRISNVLNQRGGGDDDFLRGQASEQVWSEMVNEIILDREFESAGLAVSEAELYDMFAGREISPLLRDIFFAPGQPYDQNRMKQLLAQLAEDPEQAEQLRLIEDYAARARARERYLNMIRKCFAGSDALAQQKYTDQNRRFDISYLGVNYSAIPDSAVTVSDSDIRAYISRNKHKYQQKEAETVIRFARFDLRPSQADSSRARAELMRYRPVFASTDNDSVFTLGKTRNPYKPSSFLPLHELPEALRDSLRGAEKGYIAGPLLENGYYKYYKVAKVRPAEKPSAKVRHILLNFTADTTALLARANDLARQARSGDFAAVASENSDDFNSRTKGGDLGWYRPDYFGDAFNNAVRAASPGSIIGPIKGLGGYHIVQVLDKSSSEYSLAEIEVELIYGTQTRDSVYGRANQFAARLLESKDINAIGPEFSAPVLESNALTENTHSINGLQGGRDVVLWALYEPKGAVSKVFRVKDSYVVAQVREKRPEGLREGEEVRAEVEPMVRNEKKAKLILEKLKPLAGQELNAIRDAYGAGAFVNTATNITFESGSVPGMGADQKLIGTITGMAQGQVSAPIQGDNGVFIIQVTQVSEPPAAEQNTLGNLKLAQARLMQNQIENRVIEGLKELAGVEDKRAKTESEFERADP
jgi:peptidyl-prolyl cis-trans isomerase D